MKLIRKKLEKDDSGDVTLYVEDSEDLWYAYNLIQKGDQVTTKSMRRIVTADKEGQSKGATRKLMTLQIRVEKVDFDTIGNELRLSGPVAVDTEFVSAGTYHSFNLELHRNFTIAKQEWDIVALDLIERATNVEAKAEVAAVVMQEGLANICLLTDNMTIVRQRVEQSIPKKKRGDNSGHEKGLVRFYSTVYETMTRNLTIDTLRAVLLASPGFVARGFYDYMMQRAVEENTKTIVKAKAKFVVLHSSSGHVHSLQEVLNLPEVQKQLADTKYGRETAVMDQFMKSLNDDDLRACYGPKHVDQALEKGAVQTLLVSDSLFRSTDIAERKKYVAMVEQLRNNGREVLIFSSMHESGEQLDELTGIAALLMYPLELDEEDE